MAKNNCAECEKDILLKYSDLQIEYNKLENYNKLLENCLDIKEELCNFFRTENEELKNKLKIYKEQAGGKDDNI